MGAVTIKKSYKDGHVGLRVSMKASDWSGDSLKVDGAVDLTSIQARELATALIEEADKVDAKVAAKKASDERRKKWRDREIAAGRMKVFSSLR